MITLRQLWREFLPLAWSDINLALVDPAITTTLTHMPDPRTSLAAVGVGKAVAVLFESPIYKLLHASNALARSPSARRALFRFMVLAMGVLTVAFAVVLVPVVFGRVAHALLGIDGVLADRVHVVLACLLAWPAAIAWRRYFQGLLIRAGALRAIQWCATARLATVITTLALGFRSCDGAVLGAVALIAGAILEAALLTIAARGITLESDDSAPLPRNVRAVLRYYWPLASSALVVWGGRAVLLGVIARATDGALALAAWPAAWGLIILIANATRMVNQVVIRNRGRTADTTLVVFAVSVGAAGVLALLVVAATPLVGAILSDPELIERVRPVLLICGVVPLLVAIQNALQGFLIESGRTGRVNASAWLGTATLLASTLALIGSGWSGASSAAVGTLLALAVETALLAHGCELFRRTRRPMTTGRLPAR